MELETEQAQVLAILVGRVLQPNEAAQAVEDWQGQIARELALRLDSESQQRIAELTAGLDAVAAESWAIFGYDLRDLPPGQQDELLARVQDELVRTEWKYPSRQFVPLLVEMVEAAADQWCRMRAKPGEKE